MQRPLVDQNRKMSVVAQDLGAAAAPLVMLSETAPTMTLWRGSAIWVQIPRPTSRSIPFCGRLSIRKGGGVPGSIRTTRAPRRKSPSAAVVPAGPAPITAIRGASPDGIEPIGPFGHHPVISGYREMQPSPHKIAGGATDMQNLLMAAAAAQTTGPAFRTGLLCLDLTVGQKIGAHAIVDPADQITHAA